MVSALVTNPDKLAKALDGETVNIDLSSVSLLTPDRLRGGSHSERLMLENQTAALRALADQKQPVQLNIRDDMGAWRIVLANIHVRNFNFGVNGGAVGNVLGIPSNAPGWKQLMGWGYAMERNDPELTRLLGESSSGEVGGDVSAKLRALRQEQTDLRAEMQRVDPSVRPAIAEEIEALEKQHDNLQLAAEDVKGIWRDGSFVSGGTDPYKMVSRLTLIGHLMDETPLFNCKSGKDRTGQLDAEVKFLAALGDKSMLPRPEENEHRAMRGEFTLNSGNLEMQKLNTGLPGFKLDWKQVPGLANMLADESLESAYRGGSDYVKS